MLDGGAPLAGRLQLDAATFAERFNRRPFTIGHRLADHPLFALPRLAQLATGLARGGPRGSVLSFHADHEVDQGRPGAEGRYGRHADGRTFVTRDLARPDMTPGALVEAIEACNAWMQIRDIAADAEYAALLDELLEEFRLLAEPLAPGMSSPRADIFVSSPGATTPFHLDEEHNFLLQVRGTKTMHVADGGNREVLSEDDLAAFYRGEGELARYAPRLETWSELIRLGPGVGVHIPPCHPHWVQNDDAVSISLGILWHSDLTAGRRQVYRVNAWLRALGLRPSPVGASPRLDALKAAPLVLKRRARRLLGRAGPRPPAHPPAHGAARGPGR